MSTTSSNPASLASTPSTSPHRDQRIRQGLAGITAKASTMVGKVRVRHYIGADGLSYRAYVPGKERGCSAEQLKRSGETVLKVKTADGIAKSGLSQTALISLLRYSLAGKRKRAVRVVEVRPGRFRIAATYRQADGQSMTLERPAGWWSHDDVVESTTLSEDELCQQLQHFARMEAAFESGFLNPVEISAVLNIGRVPASLWAKVKAGVAMK